MTEQEFSQLKREVAELKTFKTNLERSFSIPKNVQDAFTARLTAIRLLASSKLPSDEDYNIVGNNGSFDVPNLMDGFVKTTHPTTGVEIHLPYWS